MKQWIGLNGRRASKSKSKRTTGVQEVVEETPPASQFHVASREELDAYFEDSEERFRDPKGNINYDDLLKALVVEGDTQIIGSPTHPETVHPVVKLLHQRKRTNSTCVQGPRPDKCRIALAVEGGGMRGCISAGMVAAIYYLGLEDTIDVVYGSSAGTVIGSYFITRQLQWLGPEIYYDSLTSAGSKFINTKRLLRALGFGLADPRLVKDVVSRRNSGKPVLNLDFLLKDTVQQNKQLDWNKFVEMQKVQPLKVIASGLKSEKAIIMDMEKGYFRTLDELTRCQHASCLLPGIAGPVMNIHKSNKMGTSDRFLAANGIKNDDYEPMADALLYEPMPYHSAVAEGATHVIVLRTRPDGIDVTGKSSVFEKFILRRFFARKNKLPNMFRRMRRQLHKKVYAASVIELNEAALDNRDPMDTSSGPQLLPIALPPGSEEVTRLETGREAIFQGVRRGFARAYDALVEDPSERGKGALRAKEFFPDEILEYDPTEIRSDDDSMSAFETYLGKKSAGTEKELAHGSISVS